MSTKESKAESEKNQKTGGTYQGKLLIDTICVPANIAYPTDIGLLNHAREKLEDIIDTLHKPFVGKQKTP